jgi:dihydrofolate synthase/folylpolyglutamate synthase
VRERIRIGKKKISKKDFSRILTTLIKKSEKLLESEKISSLPTYFEFLTCLAFYYFNEKQVDTAVLEVGMGGRFDATNVVVPLVTIITTISAEHQDFLGKSVDSIAFEKAGIIKKGVPVVCGVKSQKALKVIKERAKEKRAPLFEVFSKKLRVIKKERGYTFEYKPFEEKFVYSPSLPGKHQGENAAVAIAACEWLKKTWAGLEKKKIIKGIESVCWHGRLEIAARKPLVVLDGAHNEEGARALKQYTQDFLSSPVVLIFTVMKDKKIKKLTEILFPLAEKIILAKFPYHRAALPEEIMGEAGEFSEKVVTVPDLREAVHLARKTATSKGTVLVAGSLYLVGAVKQILHSS